MGNVPLMKMNRMVKLVVAVAQNGIIGGNNQLLWKLSADLKHFKALTTGHVVVMGRKTYESIGRPLPNRVNVVISRKKSGLLGHEVTVLSSWEEAQQWVTDHHPDKDLFVIGGGEIYRLTLPDTQIIYRTTVFASKEGDTSFPDLSPYEWRCISADRFSADEKNEFDYQFEVWERIQSK